MTIGSGDLAHKPGVIVDLASGSGSVANNVYSVAGDEAQWTNSVVPDAPMAVWMLECTFATAPAAGSGVLLYLRKMDIDGTSDGQVPSDTFQEGFITRFPVEDINTIQRIMRGPFAVPNYKTSSVFEIYIKVDETAQTMSAGWRFEVTPFSFGQIA
jgi:hypothetical protein